MAKNGNATETSETPAAPTSGTRNYNERRWMKPSERAKGYANDRRSKVHTYGPKEGQPLTEYDKGIRSGYLLAQSDHAGIYKYKQALAEGKTIEEARRISRTKGKPKEAA